MTTLPIFQVDAFTTEVFRGNPAAVVPLDEWLTDAAMQAIAAENNLSETAFFVREGDELALRWFTPSTEVDLCGHATLASAYVVMNELTPGASEVRFRSPKSGELVVTRDGERLVMDFPARPPEPCSDAAVGAALGLAPEQLFFAYDRFLASYSTAEEVAALEPDIEALAQLRGHVIVTAPGRGVDFVSRFFAPLAGVAEDPVTGSAHCTLVPYWAKRLSKPQLRAHQISKRGGELWCRDEGQRVSLAGNAVLYLRGEIFV